MSTIKNLVRKFHTDEAGNEAVTNVAILAVGATVLIALLSLWTGTISPQVTKLVKQVLGISGGADE